MINRNNQDREVIREYLLGHLDRDEAAETSMSEEILFDDKLAEVVESVEDEIIEEYLEGTLDPNTRKSVEGYFLQPPERQEKLRFTRAMERYLAAKPTLLAQDLVTVADEPMREVRVPHVSIERVAWWRLPFWAYGPIVAMVVFGLFAAGYVSVLQRKMTALEDDLGQEKAHNLNLTSQLSELQSPIVVLSLVLARPRSGGVLGEIPHLEVRPTTERIVVEVAVENQQASAYEVRLQTQRASEPVWAAKLLPIVSANGDGRLVFDLPAKALRPGVYSLQVSELAKNGATKYYDFTAETPR